LTGITKHQNSISTIDFLDETISLLLYAKQHLGFCDDAETENSFSETSSHLSDYYERMKIDSNKANQILQQR